MRESVKGIVLDCERIAGVGMAAFVEPCSSAGSTGKSDDEPNQETDSEWEESVEPA